MKSLAWLIIPQALIGSLASWYYGARIDFGIDQMLHKAQPLSMRWIDLGTLAFLLLCVAVMWRQSTASRSRRDAYGIVFRVATLALFVMDLFLCGLVVWAFFFVPYVPNSFPPWSTGTTLAVAMDCIALPCLIVAGLSFAASVLYVFTQNASSAGWLRRSIPSGLPCFSLAAPKTKFGIWARRAVCIGGGAVTAAVLIFVYAITTKPITGTLGDRIRMIALGCPVAAIIGGSIGALIVFRAEKFETK